MANFYKIPDDDPDLEAFERLIADFHPWYRQFKNKKEDRPSYKRNDFYERAFEEGPFPGIDDPYCPFALTFFNKSHLYRYILQCHLFLQMSYGRKRDKGIEKMSTSFGELAKGTNSVLIRDLKLLTERSCAIWLGGVTRDFVVDDRKYINSELQKWTVNECQKISDELMALSKSEELDFGELKTLDIHGRYAVLAKCLLQEYMKILPYRIPVYISLWWGGRIKSKKQSNKKVKCKTPAGYEEKIPQYIEVVLAHHLVKKLDSRPEVPSSPTDFIYKVINKNKFAKSRDLRALYRWLFIKAWLYSYLKQYSLTLSEVAELISNDDRFFYMSDMSKIVDATNESDKEDIQQARFLDLKNNLSAWANNKSEKGYIYSQILLNSKDQI